MHIRPFAVFKIVFIDIDLCSSLFASLMEKMKPT